MLILTAVGIDPATHVATDDDLAMDSNAMDPLDGMVDDVDTDGNANVVRGAGL